MKYAQNTQKKISDLHAIELSNLIQRILYP